MKKVLILGAGTGGTMMANKLRHELSQKEWEITLVDQSPDHHYQPGYLFIPFGIYKGADVIRPKRNYLDSGIRFILDVISGIDPESKSVALESGKKLTYDFLIIATGAAPNPDETEGMSGEGWYKNAFDFYTYEGATALARHLRNWEGGKLVVNIVEMPIKCPVAPLEFSFLADEFFTNRHMRDRVDITYVTPLDAAFTKPVAARHLGNFLHEKNINLVTDFNTGSVDYEKNQIQSWDGKTVDFDLLISIPTNMGAPVIGESGLGDDLNYVPTDPKTLRSKQYDDIFVIGDATDIPASKAGSVAHFAAETLTKNFLRVVDGFEPLPEFDGHANCYIESGFGKGLLIDFNYDVEPLPGKYPLPGIGPFTLLQESRTNHWGKLLFRWIYFNMLIRGVELPVPAKMMMAGKQALQEA
ncbi:MAG: NAD(P)/FAD-dependent oxidoreductase [Bacteroidetes bacterium]|nr:NAD(P)/FAD-dependent oxidoreductase [Bacteroidota bacterium]